MTKVNTKEINELEEVRYEDVKETSSEETVTTKTVTTKTVKTDQSPAYEQVNACYEVWKEMDEVWKGTGRRPGTSKLCKLLSETDELNLGKDNYALYRSAIDHMLLEFRKGWTPDSENPIVKAKSKKGKKKEKDKKSSATPVDDSSSASDSASSVDDADRTTMDQVSKNEKDIYSEMSVTALRKELKELGVKGHSKSNRETCAAALRKVENELAEQMSMKS